jgi:hypothetical protein
MVKGEELGRIREYSRLSEIEELRGDIVIVSRFL